MTPTDNLERERTPASEEALSPRQDPNMMNSLPGGKERRNPSITPRKFKRFFTPRSLESTPHSLGLDGSSSRHALQDITEDGSSKRNQSTPIQLDPSTPNRENGQQVFTRNSKRRKLFHSPALFKKEFGVNVPDLDMIFGPEGDIKSLHDKSAAELEDLVEEQLEEVRQPPVPIKRRTEHGLAAQILKMSIGSSTRSPRQHDAYPVNDWQNDTASFYSRPEDVHNTRGATGTRRVIPFCTTSCNKSSLTAIGDEEGRVRFLETDPQGRTPFKDIFLSFRVHTNAIIDMVFSEDDMLLATASGDQTARVVDVLTQTTLSILGNHSASLKQVRFQPGANSKSVLATSSRDGSVQIWDLRCKGTDGPMQDFYAKEPLGPVHASSANRPTWARAVNSIWDAHRYPSWTQPTSLLDHDYTYRTEAPGKTGESVTAITFLAQENLLATSSQGNASIRIWDLRSLHNQRKTQTPLSQTASPVSHTKFRNFGISSLSLSGDGSRLYSLSKDNTVYAYSTSHLILGHAPELSKNDPGPHFSPKETKPGLGPLYGFRHPHLHATSFYVKTAIRKAQDGHSELLAVGSSDGSPILFPTDERYFGASPEQSETPIMPAYTQPPIYGARHPRHQNASSSPSPRHKPAAFPISTNGTPLTRGHSREVSSLSWTANGELITLGDDFLVRCWREGDGARDLRSGGEDGGRRWGCGWADVSEDYDEEDDDPDEDRD